jgi:hypothetical protein
MAYDNDPKVQYHIGRCTARQDAVALCVAGKIKLEDIESITDKLTLLQYGCLDSGDDFVRQELLRINDKVRLKAAAKQKYPTKDDDGPPPTEEEAQAELERQQNAGDVDPGDPLGDYLDSQHDSDATTPDDPAPEPQAKDTPPADKVQCPECLRYYKNEKTLATHQKKVHMASSHVS